MINVTEPFLPPIEEYRKLVDDIWKRNWLTNNGPLVNELELKLKEYLGLNHLLFLNNGTIAIQIAMKALGLKDEIITTPFSFIATTSSIVWEGCKPVFVDIDPNTLNIDPKKIEDAITDKTTGIIATHVFGNPCDINAIDTIAKKHNLKVIYDGAHCFGSKYEGKSVFNYGDVTTASFHATKLFHTIEGGAVTTRNPDLLKRMASMRNFGFNGPDKFDEVGINGKNSEFHAAMGLINLRYAGDILETRKKLCAYYDQKLKTLKASKPMVDQSQSNYSYYPIIFENETQLLKSLEELNNNMVYPRRYFYPSLNSISYVMEQGKAPISEAVSQRVLCLPLYHNLSFAEIDYVCRMLLRVQNN